jgi:hypothetical protein
LFASLFEEFFDLLAIVVADRFEGSANKVLHHTGLGDLRYVGHQASPHGLLRVFGHGSLLSGKETRIEADSREAVQTVLAPNRFKDFWR